MRVAGVVLSISVSMLLGCASSDTVVAANVQSSNDNQYNGTTDNGRKGGLLDPGIAENILNPASTSTTLRIATKVRLTVSQTGQTAIEHETTPAANSWTLDQLDAAGMPVKDAMGMTVKETHKGIGAYFERIKLPDGWSDGKATLKAEALDASGQTVLSAVTTFDVNDNGVVYVPVDLMLPVPEPTPPVPMNEAGAGGAANDGGAGSGGA